MPKTRMRLEAIMNKFKQWLYRFMYGRYGMDTLNRVLSAVVFIILIVTLFLSGYPRLILSGIGFLLLVYIYFRMFSRDIYKRSKENEKVVHFFNRIKNIPKYRYFKCPTCKVKIRVPRHKGKIEITCPKCRGRFIKKT